MVYEHFIPCPMCAKPMIPVSSMNGTQGAFRCMYCGCTVTHIYFAKPDPLGAARTPAQRERAAALIAEMEKHFDFIEGLKGESADKGDL